MNPQEQKLHYPLGDALPALGRALDVAPGVRWLRMPLPFALDHVNLWLVRDRVGTREGWTVVDCGIDRPEVRAAWEEVFATALDGLPVLRVLVTHMHPDHVGLAHWLCQRWQVPLWMTMTDYTLARLWAGADAGRNDGAGGEALLHHFARHGLTDPDLQAQMRSRRNQYGNMVPDMPHTFHRIMAGDLIRIGEQDWHVLIGYGHAPEHAAFWCPALDVLISGDMVLPRISTNVSVFAQEPEANPLTLYLSSLKALQGLPEDARVLPSHGRPFTGLQERINQQLAHHEERLAATLEACAQPRSAHDLLPVLFHRRLDSQQMSFAMGESIAHLHALYFQGSLQRTLDADGVYRFQRT